MKGEIIMIDYNQACKIAYEYYKEAWKISGLSMAKDLGEMWIFYPSISEPFFGDSHITVSKKDGQIENFNLPDENNFHLLKNATIVEIPKEFKITVEEAIELYSNKFGGYPSFLMMGAKDEYVINTIIKAIESGKEIVAEHDDKDY